MAEMEKIMNGAVCISGGVIINRLKMKQLPERRRSFDVVNEVHKGDK
jgi:hypothetical protein